MILGIDNIGIASPNPEALAEFYRSIGFEIIGRNDRGVTVTAGTAKFFIFGAGSTDAISRSVEVLGNPPGIDHISLRVDDVDATYAELRSRSIDFISAPADQDWGARTAVLRDPDGTLIFFIKWRA